MAKPKADLLQGTLDLLVLKTLDLEPMHGWGITQRIHQLSESVLQVNQGSLYPALHRLEERGWIRPVDWKDRRQPYTITRAGREHLRNELANLDRVVRAGLQRLKNA